MILPVVLYGCETWSLTFKEERRIKVLKNRVLRSICGPKSDEVTGEWRKLRNEELYDVYSSHNIVRIIRWRMRWAGHVARLGERRGLYRDLMEQLEGKRLLGRPRLRWENNIKMDLQALECGNMDWIALAQVRDRLRALATEVMTFGFHKLRNFLTS
jgi:hypothetical protein